MKNNNIKILATIGPSSLDEKIIKRMDESGVNIFRINLSHTNIIELEKIIQKIRSWTDKSICIDTEGAQIRTGNFSLDKITVFEGELIKIYRKNDTKFNNNLFFLPINIENKLIITDLLHVDFSGVLLKVVEIGKHYILTEVLAGGIIGNNKAVTCDRYIYLPPISEKDKKAMEIAKKNGIEYIAMSFVNSARDVELLKSLLNNKQKIISKIETRNSLINLKDIIKQSDAILIDRGDLSREIPLEEIPIIQKEVIKKVKQNDKSVYIATNLLESMVVEKTPNRAEINDIMNTLIDGADGLVLAAETAIGSNPLLCISIINRVISAYKIITKKEPNNKILLSNTISHLGLISPYGGNIKIAKPSKIDREDQSIVTIPINRRFILDAEQIAIGGFSPIKGFMNTDEIYNVLINQKLQDGTFWPLPIFLQVHKTIAMKLKIGEKYILQDEKTGLNHSLIQVSDIKKINFKETNKLMFGTNSQNHPGVNSLKNNGGYFIGGNITLIKSIQLPYSTYLLTPLKTRQIFEKKGWHKVAGFHSRNVVHRGHEFIHKKVYKEFTLDGLLLHPMVGSDKKNDFRPDVILETYKIAITEYYKSISVLLSGLLYYPRFAGPKEALLTAIIRRNYGCSHFIIGRDHSGLGKLNNNPINNNIYYEIDNIGIKIIKINEVCYSEKKKIFVINNNRDDNSNKNIKMISGTDIRNRLNKSEKPPKWLMRSKVSKYLIDKKNKKEELFL